MAKKQLVIPNADEYVEHLELSYIARIQKNTGTLESTLAVAYKVQYTLTIKPSNPTSRCVPWRNKNLC